MIDAYGIYLHFSRVDCFDAKLSIVKTNLENLL